MDKVDAVCVDAVCVDAVCVDAVCVDAVCVDAVCVCVVFFSSLFAVVFSFFPCCFRPQVVQKRTTK